MCASFLFLQVFFCGLWLIFLNIFHFGIFQFPGRSLIFVNSIKTARRLDGLLRALGVNCRTLHAQLQQKQRLNALESFSDLPVGVLGELYY